MTRYEYDEDASAEFRMDVVHEMDEATRAPASRSDLKALGFQGFVPFAHLPAREVPTQEGVYAIVRPTGARPEFLAENPSGRHKERNPTVPKHKLLDAWVDGVEVVYIGKATAGAEGRRGLRKRLEEYRRHGTGEPVGHWGGRYIWQLADSAELLVAWLPTPDEDPGDVESRLIGAFTRQTGKLPFANLNRGRRGAGAT